MNRIQYMLGALFSIPFLPLMYLQARKIKATIPSLPEAEGPKGIAGETLSGPGLRLLTLGESTIAGVGVESHEEGFSGTLAKILSESLNRPVHWVVQAKSGFTAKSVQKKLVPKINQTDLDLIVIGLGGNDAFTLNRPWKWGLDIMELIRDLQTRFPDTPIVFNNMPPIRDFPAFTPLIKTILGNLMDHLGNELDSIAKDENKVYYNSRKITLDEWIGRFDHEIGLDAFFSDGVHPSKLTYQLLARDMAEFILNQEVISEK